MMTPEASQSTPLWVRLRPIALALFVVVSCTPKAPSRDGFEEAEAVANQMNGENLMPWIEDLVEGHLSDPKLPCDGFEVEPMYPACELSRDSAMVFVEGQLAAFGYAPERLVLEGEPLTATNIVAELPGATLPEEVVLLGAHFDAFHGGADDNSSGVAVMLEAARVFATRRTKRTVRFIGFDLEEFGLLGSHRYVERGYADDVICAIILDTIAFASNRKNSQDAVTGLPMGEDDEVGDFIAVVGNQRALNPLQRLTALNHAFEFVELKTVVAGGDGVYPITGQLMRSDHGAFWLRGKSAMMFTDSANFRNPNYHQETDTPETLDPEFLEDVARLVIATVALLAGAEP